MVSVWVMETMFFFQISNRFFRILSILSVVFLISKGETKKFDIVIYGGTSAGIAAAVQAKKMQKSVVVVSPDLHLEDFPLADWAGQIAGVKSDWWFSP